MIKVESRIAKFKCPPCSVLVFFQKIPKHSSSRVKGFFCMALVEQLGGDSW